MCCEFRSRLGGNETRVGTVATESASIAIILQFLTPSPPQTTTSSPLAFVCPSNTSYKWSKLRYRFSLLDPSRKPPRKDHFLYKNVPYSDSLRMLQSDRRQKTYYYLSIKRDLNSVTKLPWRWMLCNCAVWYKIRKMKLKVINWKKKWNKL